MVSPNERCFNEAFAEDILTALRFRTGGRLQFTYRRGSPISSSLILIPRVRLCGSGRQSANRNGRRLSKALAIPKTLMVAVCLSQIATPERMQTRGLQDEFP